MVYHLPESMRQWVSLQDGIENLKLESATTPTEAELKPDEVLVEIRSVALNYRDIEVCNGEYTHHASIGKSPAVVPVSDMCGTVVFSKAPSLRVGARVISTFIQDHLTGQVTEQQLATTGLGLPLNGVLTQYRIFPASGLVEAPSHLTDAEASTLPIASVTAWMAINSFNPIGEPLTNNNKFVLLQGTGGVSVAGLQLAKAMGLNAIITSSSEEKLQRAKDLGADYTINYRTTIDWDKNVLELTNGRGADIIFEVGGAQTLEKSFECVAFGGIINAIGYLSGKKEVSGEKLHVNVLAIKRNATLRGILNGPRDRLEEMIQIAYAQERGIKPVIDKVFSFEQAKEALKYMQDGKHFGKVVINVV